MRIFCLAIGFAALAVAAPATSQNAETNWAARWEAMTPANRLASSVSILSSVKAEIASINVSEPVDGALKRAYDRCFAQEKIDAVKVMAALDEAYARPDRWCYDPRRTAIREINFICAPYEREESEAFGPTPPRVSLRPCAATPSS